MASVSRAEQPGNVYSHTWNLTTADPTGDAISFAGAPDKTVQFIANTAGTATAALEGSNDGTNWNALTDPQGNAITATATAMEVVMENPLWVRARLSTVGTGAIWTVIIISRVDR